MAGFFKGGAVASVQPEYTLPRCGACKLDKQCNSPKMPVSGDGKRKILIVAEAPGAREDEQGTQLVGESGQFLRRVLRRFDVDLDEDCWKTNALICRPKDNRNPTDNEIEYCRPNLRNAIKEYQPEIIIPLGKYAVKSVIGMLWPDVGEFGRWSGWRIPDQKLNAWICPTWHPSYLIREKDNKALHLWFDHHIEAAVGLQGRPYDVVPDHRKNVRVEYNADAAGQLLRQVAVEWDLFAFDYETNTLKPDPDHARIVSCAVTWGSWESGPIGTIAYPWHGDAIAATGELLRGPKPKIAGNKKFEDRWTRKMFGHRVRNWWWDTVNDAHLIDNRTGITSVKFQAYVLLGQPDYSSGIKSFFESASANVQNRIHELDLGKLLMYNGLDALLEFHIALKQAEVLGL